MSLTLHVDAARWRSHVQSFGASDDSRDVTIVPVTKGNGYGFGNSVLAAEAASLGATTLAVGTLREIGDVTAFPGDVLVLEPWRPGTPTGDDDAGERVVHTVSRRTDLELLAASGERPRVVVEVLTSMRRFGISPDEVAEIAALFDQVRFEGFALHFPLGGGHDAEARELGARSLAAAEAAGVRSRTLWVSHLSPTAAGELARTLGAEVRLRVATALWLGERSALSARATVLDAHRLRRGERYGYRQRRAPADGTILVVGGGTAHGIALEAPAPATSARQRAVSLAKGGLEAVGRALSPYRVAGKQRWFAEPPHMQCSLIWLPADIDPPEVGTVLDVDVRFTTTAFDDVAWDEVPAEEEHAR